MFVVPVFKYETLSLIPHQSTARSEEQVLHTRHYRRDNEIQMTFQEEL